MISIIFGIVIGLIYFFILTMFLIILIIALKRGKIENLVAGTLIFFVPKNAKINQGVMIINKQDSPRAYWTAIILDLFFILFGLWVGFLVYNKIIGL